MTLNPKEPDQSSTNRAAPVCRRLLRFLLYLINSGGPGKDGLNLQNKACVNCASATSTTSLWMDTRSASASPSVMASPSSLWRLAERRNRKSGSGNIFSTVNLWQLQRLFKAAGDEDAEQRAQLVWGRRDEAELAQALIALRSRGHRRALRTNGRDAMGSHWLRAFSHLRIGETSPRRQGKDAGEDRDFRAETKRSPESYRHSSFEATSGEIGAESVLTEIQNPNGNFDRATTTSSRLRRTGESNPERYLHRILH